MLSRPGGTNAARRRQELSPERKELIHRYMTEPSDESERDLTAEEIRLPPTPGLSENENGARTSSTEVPEPKLPPAKTRVPVPPKALAASAEAAEGTHPQRRTRSPVTKRVESDIGAATEANQAGAEPRSEATPDPAPVSRTAVASRSPTPPELARAAPEPTVAYAPGLPPAGRSAGRRFTNIAYLRAEQPEVIWYAFTAAIAIVIGIAIPLMLH
jgi:hypothetical protein